MTITRAQFALLLEPKLSNVWNEAFPQRPLELTTFTNTRTAQKAQITDYKMTDFGPLVLKGEGNAITYTDPISGGTKVYTPVRFGLGYKITQEMLDQELYGQMDRLEAAMMKSAIDGQETIAANILNGAFGTTDSDGYSSTGFDSLQLCSTAHTRLDGGANQANRPATDVDLGLTGLQNAVIAFDNLKDDRGRPSLIRPKRLIVSPEDKFTARELLNSEYKPGSANNDVNALSDEGLSYFVSHYKTDTDAWFLLGDMHDINFIWDVKPRQASTAEGEDGFDKEIIKRKCVQGFIVGFGEWRGIYGSAGA
jgi:hypothetical protein